MERKLYNVMMFGNNIGAIQVNNPLNREDCNDIERMFKIFPEEGFDMFNKRSCKKLHIFLNINDNRENHMDREQIIIDLFSRFMDIGNNKLVIHINKSSTVDYDTLMTEIRNQFDTTPSLKKYIKINTSSRTLFANGIYYYYYRTGSTKLPGLYKRATDKEIEKCGTKVIWIGDEPYVRI